MNKRMHPLHRHFILTLIAFTLFLANIALFSPFAASSALASGEAKPTPAEIQTRLGDADQPDWLPQEPFSDTENQLNPDVPVDHRNLGRPKVYEMPRNDKISCAEEESWTSVPHKFCGHAWGG